MFSLLFALSAPVHAATLVVDTVGGTSSSNTGNWDYKLNTYDATSFAVLEEFEVWAGANWFSQSVDVTWVVYEETSPGVWDLLWSDVGAVGDALDWHASPAIGQPLVPGRSYAIGIVLPFENVDYFWDNSTNEVVGWGTRTGGMYSGNGSQFGVPDPLYDSISSLGYRQRLTVNVLDDLDGDGWPEYIDCDDSDASVNPGAAEICSDGIDQDCSGVADDNLTYEPFWPDADGDGFGDGGVTATDSCDGAPAGFVDNDRDCDDGDPSAYPAAPELCDGLDQDCDGVADNGVVFTDYWPDLDGDGFGDGSATPTSTCDGAPVDHADNSRDCDDTLADVYPDAPEQCNERDDDCDTEVDEDVVYVEIWPDVDGDGFGDAGANSDLDCVERDGWVDNNGDCNDAVAAVNPDATELCDALDNDCDGVLLPDEIDSDLDGVLDCDDCAPDDPEIFPGAEDPCNGVDNDCDGSIPTDKECDPTFGEGLSVAPACGCSSTPGSIPAAGFLVVWLAAIRRRYQIPT